MKTAKQQTGSKGEEAAAQWLEQQGYTLLHKNWTRGHGDIDLILVKDRFLVFVEVKTRYGLGNLEEAMPSRKQQRALLEQAERFIQQHNKPEEYRFDLVVVNYSDGGVEFFHFPSVFP